MDCYLDDQSYSECLRQRERLQNLASLDAVCMDVRKRAATAKAKASLARLSL